MNHNITLLRYREINKKIVLLSEDGRTPAQKYKDSGDDFINTDQDLINHKYGFAWKLKKHDLVIDVDPRNGGDVSYAKLEKSLNHTFSKTVKTPGGFHVYLTLPDQLMHKLRKNIKEYPGLDFLSGHGKPNKAVLCTVPPTVRNGHQYRWHPENPENKDFALPAPESLIDLLSVDMSEINVESVSNKGEFRPDYFDVKSIINLLPVNDLVYDEWLKVGMGLHHWDEQEGLDIWIDWSKNHNEFGPDHKNKNSESMAVKWGSFSKNCNNTITIKTIYYMAKEQDDEDTVEYFLTAIDKADNIRHLKRVVIKMIKDKNISDKTVKNRLGSAIKAAFKKFGESIGISDAREMLLPDPISDVTVQELAPWCADWVLVDDNHAYPYLNLKTFQRHTERYFDNQNTKKVPQPEGKIVKASTFVMQKGLLRTIKQTTYAPYLTYCAETSPFYRLNGEVILNSYRYDNVLVASKLPAEEGSKADAAIKFFINHLSLLVNGNEEHLQIFLCWFAHQVQHPGVLIYWAPIIQGVPGIGKSAITAVLEAILGEENVGTVDATHLKDKNKGWTKGKCVNIINELKIKGRRNHYVSDMIKPFITDKKTQMQDKYVILSQLRNVTNYLFFTNTKDCIPIEDGDRRYWVIFNNIKNHHHMVELTGMGRGDYLDRLQNLPNFGAELRRYFLDYKIPENFNEDKIAPPTPYKTNLQLSQQVTYEGVTEIKELLEKGGKYYNSEIIGVKFLFRDLAEKYPDLDIPSKSKATLLLHLGYTRCSKLQFFCRSDNTGLQTSAWSLTPKTDKELRKFFVNDTIRTSAID